MKPFYEPKITPYPYKYSVLTDRGIIHFGNRNYQHYHDKIGYWSKLNHEDKKRRANYLARSEKIKAKGKYTYSANYWSRLILW